MAPHEDPLFYEDFPVLEAIWGEGFMSPGGAEEVGRIVGDADLGGATVLDVGCGAGGASVALVEEHGAAEVIGIDPMDHLIRYCRDRAKRLGLDHCVHYELMQVAGSLDFPAASFDAVFSKDALLHAADKEAAFRELRRVLRPGGRLLIGDWFRGEGEHLDDQVAVLSEGMWTMVTLGETVDLVERCGFVVDDAVDRQAWYAEMVVAERDRFDSEWGEEFAREFGQEAFDGLREEWIAFAAAAQSGALSPGHLRATKAGRRRAKRSRR
jgi:phosphoethanolamine N-methyltransferase